MRFPNKVNPYKTTVIYAMQAILAELNFPKKTPELYRAVKSKGVELETMVDGLTCLYALGKIENREGMVSRC